jgi:hypothetical protein
MLSPLKQLSIGVQFCVSVCEVCCVSAQLRSDLQTASRQLLQAPQRRQSAKLFIQSSELGLPYPLTRRRVWPPSPFGSEGRGTLAGGRKGRGSPNSDEGIYTVVIFINMYFVAGAVKPSNT